MIPDQAASLARRFAGKVVMVTGAGGGIGSAVDPYEPLVPGVGPRRRRSGPTTQRRLTVPKGPLRANLAGYAVQVVGS